MSGKTETLEDLSIPCFKMEDEMRMGPVAIRVRDIKKEVDFYQLMGVEVLNRYQDSDDGLEIVELGFKNKIFTDHEPILILKSDPNATISNSKTAGMTHFAILIPDRKSLGLTYLHLKNLNFKFDRFACQWVKEAVYLKDPENNGVEFYRDTPRNKWSYDEKGELIMGLEPLDLEGILGEISAAEKNKPVPFDQGGKLGHLQIKCVDMKKSTIFYHNLLGLKISHMIPGIFTEKMLVFTAAGSYHHHVALNTLESCGGYSHKKGNAGLEYFTLVVSGPTILRALSDHIHSLYPSQKIKELDDCLWVLDPDDIPVLIKYLK